MMKDIQQLFDGWVDGSLTKEEAAQFLEALKDDHPDFPLLIDQLLQQPLHAGMGSDTLRERLYNSIAARKATPEIPVRKLVRFPLKWAAAAAVLIIAGIAAWWMSTGVQQQETPRVVMNNNDKPQPGGDKAILVLSNGEKILLDSMADGQLAEQPGSLVFKAEDGRIAYRQQQQGRTTEKVAYNTLKTPRGGQFKLTLPDGTKVWLNAASSITYPTSFTGNSRAVSITGEAYFEVAKIKAGNGDRKMPFTVKVAGASGKEKEMTITVLGTHFNVNAYAEEPSIRTTLLEGSIKLEKNNEQFLLQPAQQAQLGNDGRFRIITGINAEEILAWKNGYFYFHHTDLQTVMRQIARWYDVSIEYQNGIPDMKFGGEIPRNANLEDVLKMLEVLKLRFVVENRKIIVIP